MRFSSTDIVQLYRAHPVRMRPLLARVTRDRGSLVGLQEADLAVDRRTGITDHNNVGGSAAVLDLARRSGITASSRVLDLGCGLGGPARLLADRFGCRVDGLDLSDVRVVEARALTRLVGLSARVVIRRGDIMRARVPRRRYDVIWGQSAWMHVGDPHALIARWVPALRARGRFAIQDSLLQRPARSRGEVALVRQLEHDWAGALLDASTWRDAATASGLTVSTMRTSSRALIEHFGRLSHAMSRQGLTAPVREVRSQQAATEAARLGLIGYFTLVARR